jgi:hypothetical protein
MNKLVSTCIAVGALLAGCTSVATNSSQLTLKQVSPAQALRTLSLHVAGPVELAVGGRILNDASAGILNDASAGVVAAGGGNVAPSFHVAASVDQFADVGKAVVQLFTLDGKAEGSAVTAGEDGKVSLKAKDKVLSAVATFKVGGKNYRVATLLAAGKADSGVEIDPINTMVEARVRQVVGTNEKQVGMTFTKLKRVWSICNAANITVAKEDLEADKTSDEILARLTAVWKEAIDAKVTSQADKDEIKAFIGDLQAATK